MKISKIKKQLQTKMQNEANALIKDWPDRESNPEIPSTYVA